MPPVLRVLSLGGLMVLNLYASIFAAHPQSNLDLRSTRREYRDPAKMRGFEEKLDGWADSLARHNAGMSRAAHSFKSGREYLTIREQQVIGAWTGDFVVNDDAIGSRLQHYPAIAFDQSGNFTITWTDWRICYPDIYAKRYDSSGAPLDSGFRVSDGPLDAERKFSAIGIDGCGNFIITWEDERDGNFDIYAQRYYSSGVPLGSIFKANDDTGSASQGASSIASDSGGNHVIIWQDYRNGHWDIYAQRYDSLGTPLGTNFRVNDDTGTATQGAPSIAMDGSGSFVIVWHDDRNGNLDIYAQRYDPSGVPLDSNFRVDDDIGTSAQGVPAIVSDYFGSVVITWRDQRNDWGDIYAQRYDYSGVPLGSNFRVNDDVGSTDQRDPAISLHESGTFIITWSDKREVPFCNVYAQRYDSSGTPLGANFKVTDSYGTSSPYYAGVAIDGSGSFVIVWDDHRIDDWDVYAQRFDSAGTPLGGNFRINNPDDDIGCILQQFPCMATDGHGKLIVAWWDFRNNSNWGDIYAQRLDSSGAHLDSNFMVNDDGEEELGQYFLDVGMDGSGSFVVTWEDTREEGWDIFAQRYDSTGTPLGANFKVNSDTGNNDQYYPAVAMDKFGNFVIAWEDWRLIDPNIYAQRYDASGAPQGSNFKVNEDTGPAWQAMPTVATDGQGNFIIAWIDNRMGDDDIAAKRYNSSGEILNPDFRANDVPGSAYYPMWINPAVTPAVAADEQGNFIIAWTDERNYDWWPDIYAQRYNSGGYPVGSDFRVNNDYVPAMQWEISAASDGRGNFVITWADSRYGNWDVYAQKYDSSGTPLGSNYFVPDPGYASSGQEHPEVAADGYNIYFTWMDDRRGGGWDIFAKVAEGDWPFVRGDANADGLVNIADAVYLINYLFVGGPPPLPLDAGDANSDGMLNIADVIYLVNYLFLGGPPPCS